jgi:hypothetical protein
MPTNEWLSAFTIGLMFGTLAPALACLWWTKDSHIRSMQAYDRAMKLLDIVEARHRALKEEG